MEPDKVRASWSDLHSDKCLHEADSLTVLVTSVMFCGRFPDRLNVITFMHYYYRVCRCDNLEIFPTHISTKATALISDCGYRFILWLPFWPKMCGNFPYSAVITYVDSLELSTKNVVGLSSRERDLYV